MQQITWCLCASLCVLVALTSLVDSQQVGYYNVPAIPQGFQPAVDAYDTESSEVDREKRKTAIVEPFVYAKFGVKNKLLGLLFGKLNQFIDSKTHLVAQLDRKNIALNKQLLGKPCDVSGGGGATVTARPTGPTTTEDAVEFDNTRVSLEIPGELFGSSFSLVTDLSRIISDTITNAAERTQRLVEAVKPTFGRAFGIKVPRRRPPPSGTKATNRIDGNVAISSGGASASTSASASASASASSSSSSSAESDAALSNNLVNVES